MSTTRSLQQPTTTLFKRPHHHHHHPQRRVLLGTFFLLIGTFISFVMGVAVGFHGWFPTYHQRIRLWNMLLLSSTSNANLHLDSDSVLNNVNEYERNNNNIDNDISSIQQQQSPITTFSPPLLLHTRCQPTTNNSSSNSPPMVDPFPIFNLPKRNVIEPYNIEEILQQTCSHNMTKKSSSFQSLLNKLLDRDNLFCTQPLTPTEFICAAQCPIVEPELEHTVRIMRLAEHSPEHVIDACLRKISPFMIWISPGGRIRFLNCMQDFRSDAFMGKEVWKEDMRMLFTLSCIVQLPQPVIFGFDWGDYPAPGYTGAPHDLYKYMVPLPPILRPVGSDAHHALLFPTGSFIVATAHCNWRAADHWWKICIAHQHLRDQLPWEKRKPEIMWRGAPNGVQWTINDWRMQQRAKLVRDFGKEPSFDVAFVQDIHARSEGDQYSYAGEAGVKRLASKNQISENDPDAIVAEMLREWVKKDQIVKDDHPQYRHLLHVDGQTASWGLAHKINSGSVVLWIQSARNHREFYYPLLKPWIHYIPIQPDVSDLKSIAKWIHSNQASVKQIARNAAHLADTRMRAQDLYCYVYRLLASIKAAQVKDNIVPTESYLKEKLGSKLFDKFEDVKDFINWKNGK
jgi:hypothetical protein